ncbi:MAG: hypothetical protein AAF804_17515, partial [Bacteroidota bacterium]
MKKIQTWLGMLGVRLIRWVVLLAGKTVAVEQAAWLKGAIGPEGEIGAKPYEMVAREENLYVERDPEGALVA